MTTTLVTHAQLPTEHALFDIFMFDHNGEEHLALLHKKDKSTPFKPEDEVLVRVHSECLTGDGLFSIRCDCGPQLSYALEEISKAEQGLLIYLRQEGRGIGLTEKIKAYQLQDQGMDTYDANVALGHQADGRNYDMLRDMFAHFGVKKVRLLTNNPNKIQAIIDAGVDVVERLPIKVGEKEENLAYRLTKSEKFDHL